MAPEIGVQGPGPRHSTRVLVLAALCTGAAIWLGVGERVRFGRLESDMANARGIELARVVAAESTEYMLTNDLPKLETSADRILRLTDVEGIRVEDAQGRTVCRSYASDHSAASEAVRNFHAPILLPPQMDHELPKVLGQVILTLSTHHPKSSPADRATLGALVVDPH